MRIPSPARGVHPVWNGSHPSALRYARIKFPPESPETGGCTICAIVQARVSGAAIWEKFYSGITIALKMRPRSRTGCTRHARRWLSHDDCSSKANAFAVIAARQPGRLPAGCSAISGACSGWIAAAWPLPARRRSPGPDPLVSGARVDIREVYARPKTAASPTLMPADRVKLGSVGKPCRGVKSRYRPKAKS